ncbi:MAG: hypothetical protein COA54_10535 [Thiotrichaceae bacterium]|nr:MAG: hypothetical protein COA54_10535 [Thiotrichaceae bacterium]
MSNISVSHYLLITCIATSVLSTSSAIADWSGKIPQNKYNNQFGDFPPEDIDQYIQNSLKKYDSHEEPSPVQSTNQVSPNQSIHTPPQNYQPSARNYNQQGNYNPRPGNYRNNNRPGSNYSGFSGPWENNGSSFSMPWGGNNGSGSNMPWGNGNGSNFSMPWGNNSGNNSWGNNSRNYGNR